MENSGDGGEFLHDLIMPEPLFEADYRKAAANSALEFSSNWMIGTILSKPHAQAAWEDSVENKVNQGRENIRCQSLEPRVLTANSRPSDWTEVCMPTWLHR